MHAGQDRYTCETCRSTRRILFCRECTHITCQNCVLLTEKITWQCENCNIIANGQYCGVCGSQCSKYDTIKEQICPTCKNSSLGDPQVILNNLDSDFFSIISTVSEILPSFAEAHRKFDFTVTLVRLCRLASFIGFPQIEVQLQKCAEALKEVSERGITQLNKIQRESMYFLRQINHFKKIEIDHFRNAEAILTSTLKSIKQLNAMLEHWLEEINQELDNLMLLAEPLRQQYELLSEVTKFLPSGVHSVAAIIPPHSINVKYQAKKKKMTSYLVFTETELLCLAADLKGQTSNKVASTVRFPYSAIVKVKQSNSLIKGSELNVRLNGGYLKLIAPSIVIKGVKGYLKLAHTNENFIIGSPKDIMEIESQSPDKYKYLRSTEKFTELIRSNIFDEAKRALPDKKFQSLTELKHAINLLGEKSREIDYQARTMQIDPDMYREKRSQIKDSFFSLRDNLANLGGHLMQDSVNNLGMGLDNDYFGG